MDLFLPYNEMCLLVCVCVGGGLDVHMYEGTCEYQKRLLDFLELEL